MVREVRFRAMGADAHVLVHGDVRLLDVAVRRIEVLEARWSRFRPASELSQANAAGGRPLLVSPDTIRLFAAMREAYDVTGGTYQPAVLGALEALGYDRSLPEVTGPATLPEARPVPPFLAAIDERIGLVQLPAGVRVDPGGIGKGLAADLVADELIAAGAEGVLVNLGGDLRVRGVPEGRGPWRIAIEHPDDPTVIVGVVTLADGAIATSTVARRRWTAEDGAAVHHLVDPRTSRPADACFRQATVVCGRAQWAEVYAKCVLLDGGLPPVAAAAVLTVAEDGAVGVQGTDAGELFSELPAGTKVEVA